MDVEALLFNYSISYVTSGKNWAPGWVMISCPFCDDPSHHGGLNIHDDYYNCWRCGAKPLTLLLMKLLKIKSYSEVKKLIRQYSINFSDKAVKKKATAIECKLPENCHELQHRHKQYLTKRGFDPEKLIETWGLKGTGAIGNYKFRIIAPILVDGIIVSYQGRDVTGRQTLRYKACSITQEMIHHKHVVYGIDHVQKRCVIVEGIADVWMLGKGSIALFGTEWTIEQLLFLKKRVDGGIILFDADSTDKGTKLMNDLVALGMDFEQMILEAGDPAELTQKEIHSVMKSIR